MVNERIETIHDDKEYYLQDAPAQEERAEFTPGKIPNTVGSGIAATAVKFQGQHDENWPVEFPVKTGTSIVDEAGLNHGLQHVRVVKQGRMIVCDQVLGTTIPLTGSTNDDYNNMAGKERTTGAEKIWED